MIAVQTVHTTGVNWDGILVNAGVITTTISIIGGFFYPAHPHVASSRPPSASWTGRSTGPWPRSSQELNRHGERIAYLEGVDSGKKAGHRAGQALLLVARILATVTPSVYA